MALITCPDCNKTISDTAPTCPQCGRVMKSPVAPLKVKGEGCFLQTMNVGCAIVFAIIALIFIFAVMLR